jgi:hypothetical protein
MNQHPLFHDARQWEIIWSEPGEPDHKELEAGFRKAWDIAVADARIEHVGWQYPSREELWDGLALAGLPAGLSIIVATHADGRTVSLQVV